MKNRPTRVQRLKARWRRQGSGALSLADKLNQLDKAKQRDAAAYIKRVWGVTVTHFFKTDTDANSFLEGNEAYGVIDTYQGLVLVAQMADLGTVRA
jgi:hypothetical protein